MYRLKENVEEFEVVDGPMEGRRFRHGELYDEVPAGDRQKFEKVKQKSANQEGQKKGGKK